MNGRSAIGQNRKNAAPMAMHASIVSMRLRCGWHDHALDGIRQTLLSVPCGRTDKSVWPACLRTPY